MPSRRHVFGIVLAFTLAIRVTPITRLLQPPQDAIQESATKERPPVLIKDVANLNLALPHG